jgi:hypothetical protein
MPDEVMTDAAIAQAMITYGGSFVQALGRAYQMADTLNRARLVLAFQDYFDEYRTIARLHAQRRDVSGS